MATEKKQPIVKRKSVAAKRTASASQSFDIIPSNRVMPSASSRPVITSSSPQQADNTLAPGAPTIQTRRRKIVQPSTGLLAGDTATNDMEMPKLPALPVDEPNDNPTDTAAEDMEAHMVTEPAAAPTADTSSLSNDEIEDQVARALAGDAGDSADSDNTDKPTPDKPTPEVAPETSEIKNGVLTPPAGAVKEADEAAAPNAPEKPADDSTPAAAVAATPEAAAKPTTDDNSVSAVLSGDEASATQEHSQALKDAMEDLDENGVHHHELYGGKPVIVVHKAHTSKSLLMGLLWFVICLALALVLVDVLVDANIITIPYDLPTTNFL